MLSGPQPSEDSAKPPVTTTTTTAPFPPAPGTSTPGDAFSSSTASQDEDEQQHRQLTAAGSHRPSLYLCRRLSSKASHKSFFDSTTFGITSVPDLSRSGSFPAELSSSGPDAATEGAGTERYRLPLSFRVAPDLSGCLLQLSLDLHRKLREVGHAGNVLLSPFFVASSLVMVLRGACGNTHDQVARALHMDWDPSSTAVRFQQLAAELFRDFERAKLRCLGLTLTCFTALFFDESVPLRRDYYRLQDTMCYFMDRRDFRNNGPQCRLTMDAMARAVNSFSLPREQVFPPGSVDHETCLVLLSSLRLEGRWKNKFAVSKGSFFNAPADNTGGSSRPLHKAGVPIMHCTGPFRMADCAELEATMVEVPYENPSNAMIILLPTGPGGLVALEEKLSTPLVLRGIDSLRNVGDVELSLPKFRVRQVTNLTELLPLLGVRDAFTEEARLDGLTPAEGVRLSDVRHVATVHVSQAGAYLPRSLNASPAERKVVAVDRPFMFLVLNRRPDLVLLLGSVNNVV